MWKLEILIQLDQVSCLLGIQKIRWRLQIPLKIIWLCILIHVSLPNWMCARQNKNLLTMPVFWKPYSIMRRKMILPKFIQIKKEIPVFCHKSAGAAVKIHQISNQLCLNSFSIPNRRIKKLFCHRKFGRGKKKVLLITGIYSNHCQ